MRRILVGTGCLIALLTGVGTTPQSADAAIERSIAPNAEPTNLINITPIRIERDVLPGERTTEQISIYNDNAMPVRMTTTVLDLGPPTDSSLLAEPLSGAAEFGAKDWITPELTDTILQPFEKVTFDIIIAPPTDAPLGSSIAGVQVEVNDVDDADGSDGDASVGVRITSMLQVLLTVPGDPRYDLRLLDARTRDTFHMGSTSFVIYALRYRNAGSVNEHVRGTIRIRSLFGNVVDTIDLRERILIRGATGTDRAVWTDVPRFGVFSAEVELAGDGGEPITRSMGRVVLLPPWWLLALLMAAIIVPPVWLWWRRRREWMQYLDDIDEDEHLVR